MPAHRRYTEEDAFLSDQRIGRQTTYLQRVEANFTLWYGRILHRCENILGIGHARG